MQNLIHYRPLTNIELTDSWPNIIWREKHHCADPEYTLQLSGLIATEEVSRGLWLQSRPSATEVEVALRQAGRAVSEGFSLWVVLLQTLSEMQEAPDPVQELIANLHDDDWQVRFLARHALVAVGGQAIPPLVNLANNRQELLWFTATWLLKSIEFETTARLYPYASRLLCPHCLVYCHANWANRSGRMPFVHYGCRACGQSREFLEWTGKIVAVLDADMSEPYSQQKDVLRGNWLVYRSLIDCAEVEIINATDEDIERFTVQVGNDTDPLRMPNYEQMRCLIGCNCHPSKNAMRILQHQFGQVERATA